MVFLMQVITAMAIELGRVLIRVAVKAIRSRFRRRPRPWRVALVLVALGLGLPPSTSAGLPRGSKQELKEWLSIFEPIHLPEPIRRIGVRELVEARVASREFAEAISKVVEDTYRARYFRLSEGGAGAVDVAQGASAVVIEECDRALRLGAARPHPLGRGVFDKLASMPAGSENTEEYRRLQDAVAKAAVTKAQNRIILQKHFRTPGIENLYIDSLSLGKLTDEDVIDAKEFYELLGEAIRRTSLDEREGACFVAFMKCREACSDEEIIDYSARIGILDYQLAVLKVRKAQESEQLSRRTWETAKKAMEKLKAELPSTLGDVLERMDIQSSADMLLRKYAMRGGS